VPNLPMSTAIRLRFFVCPDALINIKNRPELVCGHESVIRKHE
jgi:hypothetical protein